MQDSKTVEGKSKVHFKGQIKEKSDPVIGLKLLTYIDDYGRKINIIPKKGFSKKFSAMGIPFGSIDDYIYPGSRAMRLPAGSAHYMEHCVFSKEDDRNLLSKMTELGASANAYTSFDHTMYYFSSSQNFDEILDLYYNTVTNPVVDQARVDSERDIILQELAMYMDNPDSRAFNSLAYSLYLKHPIKYDIGGTSASVKRITSQHLAGAKSAFYNPLSVSLTLCGDVDEGNIPDLGSHPFFAGDFSNKNLREDLRKNPQTAGSPGRNYNGEPDQIRDKEMKIYMDVAIQSFFVGYKIAGRNKQILQTPYEKMYRRTNMSVFLDTVLGETSDIYTQLFNEKLINDSFGFSLVEVEGASYLVVGGESPNPQEAAEKVKKLFRNSLEEGVNQELERDFDLKRKMLAGSFVRRLDDIDSLGMLQARADLRGIDIFDYYNIYGNINIIKAYEDAYKSFDDELSSTVFVLAKEK